MYSLQKIKLIVWVALGMCPVLTAQPLENNLLIRYSFNDYQRDAYTTAIWDSGNYAKTGHIIDGDHSRDAVASNITWVGGRHDTAVYVPSNGYISVPAWVCSAISTQMTISVWIMHNSGYTPQIGYLFDAADASGNKVFCCHLPWSDGKVYWDAGNNGAIYDRTSKTATSGDHTGEWSHWVFTKNASTGSMKIYRNGTLWHSETGKTLSMGSVATFRIGASCQNAQGFIGNIDDFRLYNRELTSSEVANLYNYKRPTIYYVSINDAHNLDKFQRYDVRHTAACIAGIVNRKAPQIFIATTTTDNTWVSRMREPKGPCEDWPIYYGNNRGTINNCYELALVFKSYLKGVVLYDADPFTGVNSTSLAATTAAGCEDAIAVRKDTSAGSMYNYLVNDPAGPRLPVLIDLTGKFTGSGTIWGTSVPSTGSKKCDAYIWAKVNYLDNGKCDPTALMYTLDMWSLRFDAGVRDQLSNLDWAVKNKAFCFDLSPWGDEKPNDDPTQPLGTDLNTYKAILNSCNVRTSVGKMIRFCGFTNWDYKYTNAPGVGGSHDPTATEWETQRLNTAYNSYSESDAPSVTYVNNASFFHGLLPEINGNRTYVQSAPMSFAQMQAANLLNANGTLKNGNFVMLGLGDYDAASWVQFYLCNGIYEDPVRGQVNCNWAINPNIGERLGVVLDYMYRRKTPADYFMAWGSGAGYVFPKLLYGTRVPSYYSSGVGIWQTHCKDYYRKWNYSISGWLLNGTDQLSSTDFDIYKVFSPHGIGPHNAATSEQLVGTVPVNKIRGDLSTYDTSDSVINNTGVNMGWYRTILWTPSNVQAIQNKYANSGKNHKFLKAIDYYYLLRRKLGGNNDYYLHWIWNNIPHIMTKGATYSVTVWVRNDGWDNWSEANYYRLGYAKVPMGTTPSNSDYDANGRVYLPSGSFGTGNIVGLTFNFTAPSACGNYDIYCDMVRDGVLWFRNKNNLELKKTVRVVDNAEIVDTDGDGVADLQEIEKGTLWWHPFDQ